MTKKFWLLISVIFVVSGGACVFGQGKDPNAPEVLRYYKESLSWLQSVSMKVDVENQGIEAGVVLPRVESHFIHRRDGKRCEWIGKSVVFDRQGNIDLEGSIAIKSIFTDKQYVDVLGPMDGPPFGASIRRNFEDEQKLLYDSPRLGGALNGNIFGNNHKNVAKLLSDANDFHVHDAREDINGVPCYVLEATTEYGKVTAWIAPEKGYSALKWSIHKTSGDLFNEDHLQSDSWLAVFDGVGLQKVGGVFVTKCGVFTLTTENSNGRKVVDRYEYKVSNVHLNPDFEAIGAFVPDIPDGTRVYVEEAPGVRYLWQDGKIVPADDPTFEEIDKMVEELKDEQ